MKSTIRPALLVLIALLIAPSGCGSTDEMEARLEAWQQRQAAFDASLADQERKLAELEAQAEADNGLSAEELAELQKEIAKVRVVIDETQDKSTQAAAFVTTIKTILSESETSADAVESGGAAFAPAAGPYAPWVLFGSSLIAYIMREFKVQQLGKQLLGARNAVKSVEAAKQTNHGGLVDFKDPATKALMKMVAEADGQAFVKQVQQEVGKAANVSDDGKAT